jgi:hypothetical protein
MTDETFTQYMDLMSATWPDRSPSEETVAAYWLALNHLADDEFSSAVMRCLQECTFYPRPAEILARVVPDETSEVQPAWLSDPRQIRRMEAIANGGPMRTRRGEKQELEHGDRPARQLNAGD